MSPINSYKLTLFRGRLAIYLEPRDLWVGVFFGEEYTYICPLPCLVFRFDRNWGS